MRTRLGLKVLGLSALVMGVMAIGTAGVAQAEVGACWGYLTGGELKCFDNTLEAKPLLAIENNTATLLISNVNLEVLCTTADLVGTGTGGRLAANGTILLGKVQFGGCVSLSKTPTLTKLNSCTPNDPVAGLGKIVTENGSGLIVLHNGEPVVLLTAHTLTLAKIFLGEECSVAEELIVGGDLTLQDAPGTRLNHEGVSKTLTSKQWAELHAPSHLIQEHSTLHGMHVGVNTALIHGTAVVTLEAPHNLLNWAASTTK